MLRALVLSLGLGLLASFVPSALAQTATTMELNIPPQPLESALRQMASKEGVQILFLPEDVKGMTTAGVNGRFTPREAIQELVKGTGLTVSTNGKDVFTIKPAGKALSPATSTGGTSQNPTLLAQAGSPSAGASEERAEPRGPGARADTLEKIVVTGTNIRGRAPVGSPLIVIDSAEIERSGYSTAQQLMDALPQNFRGGTAGASEDGRIGNSPASSTNLNFGSGVNLRGLGTESTLVLVNGTRLATAGYGRFVDISMIPLTAVERVEIVTDGSSAIYGSDAVGGVVNFILRKDYEGGEARAKYGNASHVDEYRLSATAGMNGIDGNGVITLQYLDRTRLDSRDRSFTRAVPTPTDLLPKREQVNLLGTGNYRLTSDLSSFGHVLLTHAKIDDAFTDSNIGTEFTSTSLSNIDATGGVRLRLPLDWQAVATGSYGNQKDKLSGTQTPAGAFGILNINNNAEIWAVDARANGDLLATSGGTSKLALGMDYRDERLSSLLIDTGNNRHTSRRVKAAFGELVVPVIQASQGIPFIQDLVVSAAVRRDDYSDFGSTTNPKFGLSWRANQALQFRTTYSTSFRAPFSQELLAAAASPAISNRVFILGVPTATGAGTQPIFIRLGTDPNLGPERAKTWSGGLSFAPASAHGFHFDTNYFQIDYRDRILTPPLSTGVLSQLDRFGSLVSPVPDDAAAQAFLDAVKAAGGRVLNLAGTGARGVRYIYDVRLRNVGRQKVRGVDVAGQYEWSLTPGTLATRLTGTYISEIKTTFNNSGSPLDLVNTVANPLRFRARAEATWTSRGWRFNAALNHSNRYKDISGASPVDVSSFSTVDLTAKYYVGDRGEWTRGLSLQLSVINAFDKNPPSVVGSGTPIYPAGYDVANATPLGRFIGLEISKVW